MKTLVDPEHALAQGMAELRRRYKVPNHFPPQRPRRQRNARPTATSIAPTGRS